jgi:hypothetical protein
MIDREKVELDIIKKFETGKKLFDFLCRKTGETAGLEFAFSGFKAGYYCILRAISNKPEAMLENQLEAMKEHTQRLMREASVLADRKHCLPNIEGYLHYFVKTL